MRIFVGNVGAGNVEELNSHIAELTSDAEASRQALTQLRTTIDEKVWSEILQLLFLLCGCADSQGANHSHSNVSQRAGTDLCTTSGSALFWCSAAGRSSHMHLTWLSRFFCCCSIHLELSTCWHSTVRKHYHFQTPLENPSIQTHLVLLCCIKRLCIFGPKGTIHIR